VSLPNAGTLEAAAKAGLKAPAAVTLAGPGDAAMVLRPTKKARKRLRRKGKAAGAVNLTYTPNFGAPSTQTVKVGLKLKKRRK
jgi:hypothetical protein